MNESLIKSILVLTPAFLSGYKYGGPIRSLSNIVLGRFKKMPPILRIGWHYNVIN